MVCSADSQQSLPITWLQNPCEKNRKALLEFSRGTLYSLSSSCSGLGRDVHVNRIQHAFGRLGSPNLHRVGLRLLKLLREAESLPGGYWIPTPFRVIEIGHSPVFVGALPTALGYLNERKTEGLCRVLTPESAIEFPLQDLDSWMSVPSGNIASFVDEFIQGHRAQARPINHQTESEYLSFTLPSAGSPTNPKRFHWGRQPVAVVQEEIALCRQWKFGFYRYFSADIRSGRTVSEASVDQPLERLLFALAKHVARAVTVRVCKRPESVEVQIFERLPLEEYRLALLLSRQIERQGRCSVFHLAHQFAPVLIERLKNLGCVMEIDQ